MESLFYVSQLPFVATLCAVLVIFLADLALTVAAGTGFSDLFEAIAGADSLPDVSFTNWLMVREVPLLLVILTFLTSFGLFGFAVQGVSEHYLSASSNQIIVCLLATVFGLLTIRGLSSFLQKFKVVHTDAVSTSEFIGKTAVIVGSAASRGHPVEATYTDKFGYTHYVLVEPVEEGVTLKQGEQVQLVLKVSEAVYHAKQVS